MKYFVFAFYQEAKPWIEQYHLHKNLKYTYMDVFEGDTLTVLIGGVGILRNIKHLSRYFDSKEIHREDFLLSVGGAGGNQMEKGEIYLIHSIYLEGYPTEYPDILFPHPFKETNVCTIHNMNFYPKGYSLYDMEAYGIYQACKDFFTKDQMIFLKICTDEIRESVNKEEYEEKIQNSFPFIEEFIRSLSKNEKISFSKYEKNKNQLETFIKGWNLSEQQKIYFNKKMKFYFYMLEENEILEVLDSFPSLEKCEKNDTKEMLVKLYGIMDEKAYLCGEGCTK